VPSSYAHAHNKDYANMKKTLSHPHNINQIFSQGRARGSEALPRAMRVVLVLSDGLIHFVDSLDTE